MNIREKKISERQNDEDMLKLQFAAKCHFNKAEAFGLITWLLCFASAGTALLPDSLGILVKIVAILADISILILSCYQKSFVTKAAKYREVFDANVLGIGLDCYNNTEYDTVFGDAREYCIRKQSKYNIQSKHNGKDDPPGVKDWYVIPNHYSDLEAQFECQKQNSWWDSRLMNYRWVIITSVIGVVLLMLIIIYVNNPSVGRLIQCFLSSALIVRGVERLYVEQKYRSVSREINGAIKVMNEGLCEGNVMLLQKMINEKRNCSVVGINILHKKMDKTLSEIYQTREDFTD